MHLDRTIAPPYRVIQRINLPPIETFPLANGLPLHVINIGEQPVVRLECIFEGGAWHESTPGASYFAIKMLSEGTHAHSSAQISAAFDRIGAFLELSHSFDRASLVVYCLTRFLPEVLPLVQELIQEAAFPDKEWEDLRNITLQNHRVNWEKNAFRATSFFRKNIFGESHPYGRSQTEVSITNLEKAKAIQHYDTFIRHKPYRIVLAGKVGEAEIGHVNAVLGNSNDLITPIQPLSAPNSLVPADEAKNLLIERPESIQSSIRFGKRLFTRNHPDYFKMLVTNEILGGYFGSRLMKNIREEKGLTYGISSNITTFRKEGYFMIGTDVKKEFTQQTLDEIYKEINILQTEPVPSDELQTVKNFMAGEFAGSLNTAFDVADRQKILIMDGLPSDFFEQYVDQIHATTADDVLQIARQYLDPESMTEIVVGGK
ncbi:M16 family metallopeptidase [Arundinibacter roseus]|uniref:Insulinase family protein n=1 Tax=Arundinibacter roseus TaxID=2070510 RepID=A0A4R4KL46_9BACT|nr:pitrilysin family protein [Arundinibacter roseus]TDB69050.1 insulinase family protein [Arundinibacter roseus]